MLLALGIVAPLHILLVYVPGSLLFHLPPMFSRLGGAFDMLSRLSWYCRVCELVPCEFTVLVCFMHMRGFLWPFAILYSQGGHCAFRSWQEVY